MPVPAYAPDRAAYAEAVDTLLDFVAGQSGTSGGSAAAQVLLSCFNGYDFHLSPTAIRTLSSDAHRDAALTVINQRVLLGLEPHEVIPDGDRRFGALWTAWERTLHIRHRYKDEYRRKRR